MWLEGKQKYSNITFYQMR